MATKPEASHVYVLHRRPYGERGALLELLSGEGRVSAIARRAVAAPFQLHWMELTGRGELKSVRHCEAVGPAALPQGLALYAGLYLNELTLRLLPRGLPCESLWPVYLQTVSALLLASEFWEADLRRYELALLSLLGDEHLFAYGVDDGAPIIAETSYRLDPGRGFVPAAQGIAGASLLAMAQGDFSSTSVLAQARPLFRQLIDHALAGRTLRSRELYRQALAVRPGERF